MSVLSISQLNSKIISNPKGFLDECRSGSDKLILRFFLTHYEKHKTLEYSHWYIAIKTKLSVATVKRSISRLSRLGIIQSIWRPYNTCEYIINEFFKLPSTMKLMKDYFFCFLSVSLLLSVRSSNPERELLLILKDFNLLKCTGTTSTTTPKSTSPYGEKLLYLPDSTWYFGRDCTGVPNKKRSFVEFEALFSFTQEKEQYMQAFTEEQLTTLAQYPKASLEYAQKMLTRDMAAGKGITNLFSYFHAICKAHAEKAPKTGKTMASVGKPRPSNFNEYVAGGKWVPGAEIINTPNTFQSSITHVETEIEWAMNYEQSIHQRTQLDPVFAKQTARFDKNPIWSKLNEQQRTNIWSTAHGNDCSCRKNEDAGLIMPQVATKLVARFM